jgi:hypothetical protein
MVMKQVNWLVLCITLIRINLKVTMCKVVRSGPLVWS